MARQSMAWQNPTWLLGMDIRADPVFQGRRVVSAIVVRAEPAQQAFTDSYGRVNVLICALTWYVLQFASFAIGLPVLAWCSRETVC